MFEYIKHRQKLLEKKWDEEEKKMAEEAEKEEARVAKIEAEARHQQFLLERQEDERLRQRHIQRQEKIAEEKWDKHFDTLLTQIKDRFQKDKDDKLEEIRVIIKNRQPSLQELDWDSWLSDPLNQRLADLDFDHAMEMFKRDNLLAKRRYRTRPHPPRGKKKYSLDNNYFLSFTGDTAASAAEDYVITDFNPDDYNLNLGFTVSYWVRPDEVGTHMFAFGRKYSNNERFVFGIGRANKIYIGVGANKMEGTWSGNLDDNPTGLTAAQLFPLLFDDGDLKTGNWLHFAVTYADRDNTSEGGVARKVYLNGELIQQANINWSTTGGNMDDGMYFGGRSLRGSGTSTSYNNGWDCGLDEVAIYNTAKDSDWVASVYNGETSYDHRGESGLVGYWKFNEGSGFTVKDLSGEGNHGTFAAISGGTTAYPTWGTR
jgi:hypothetical protein